MWPNNGPSASAGDMVSNIPSKERTALLKIANIARGNWGDDALEAISRVIDEALPCWLEKDFDFHAALSGDSSTPTSHTRALGTVLAIAGAAFKQKFEREPYSPSDVAWFNGYAECLASSADETRVTPVAWRYRDSRGHWRYTGSEPKPEHAILKAEPLYAGKVTGHGT